MIHENLILDAVEAFQAEADEAKALPMRRYMKDKFIYLGIKAPDRRKIASRLDKKLSAMDREGTIGYVKALWELEEREYQYYAVDFLVKKRKLLKKGDMLFLQKLITEKSWWDTVDIVATKLVGHLAAEYPELRKGILVDWSESDNIWLCRASILFQLKYKSSTDEDLLYSFIAKNSRKREFFIEKAIGWALREYSKTNPESVSDFLGKTELRPLSIREGKKYLNG